MKLDHFLEVCYILVITDSYLCFTISYKKSVISYQSLQNDL